MAGRPALRPGELGNISLAEQGSGGWVGRAWTRDGGGERRRLRSAGPSKEAVRQDLEEQARTFLLRGGILTPDSLMSTAMHMWTADRDGEVRPQSLRIYKDTVRWVEPYVGALPLKDFTPAMIKRLLDVISKERSRAGADHARTALSGAFGVAIEDGALDINPVFMLRKRARPKSTIKYLTADQVDVLRAAILRHEAKVARYTKSGEEVLRWVVEIMLGSGLRISEVLGLSHADVDLETGRIEVSSTLVDDPDTWHIIRQETLKNINQARFIDLPSYSVNALKEARASNTSIPARLPSAPAVQGRAEGKWISARNVRRSLRKLRTDDELLKSLATTGLTPEDLIPHLLRRTAATLLAAETGDVRDATALLGHSHESVTRKSYAGTAFKIVGNAQLLDKLLAPDRDRAAS